MDRKEAIHSFGLPGVQVSPRLPLLAEFNKQLGGQAEIWLRVLVRAYQNVPVV